MSGMQELLQQMLSGQQPDAGAMSAMFAEHEDPRVRLIAQFMNQETAAPAPDAEPEPIADAEVIEAARPDSMPVSLRLRRRLHRLTEELHAAQTIGDTLAAALGACYLCWGEDSDCEFCGGAGRPGWSEPDAELFASYVAPALERFRQTEDSPGPVERPSFSMPRTSAGPSNRSEI